VGNCEKSEIEWLQSAEKIDAERCLCLNWGPFANADTPCEKASQKTKEQECEGDQIEPDSARFGYLSWC